MRLKILTDYLSRKELMEKYQTFEPRIVTEFGEEVIIIEIFEVYYLNTLLVLLKFNKNVYLNLREMVIEDYLF